MRLIWLASVFFLNFHHIHARGWFASFVVPWIEMYHYPGMYTTAKTLYVNGTNTQIVGTYYTPDYRVEEKMYVRYKLHTRERERPFRLSPAYKQLSLWDTIDKAMKLACYCCTVYRKYILLAGCAVVTTRHILTTATPTDLILRTYGSEKSLEGILGGWYDVDSNIYNSSVYMTPARIHIHPKYRYQHELNVSHPIPCMYDLSVWSATFRFYGSQISYSGAVICNRAPSGWWEYASSIPRAHDLSVVIGFQFMKAYKRRPLPWYKYGVRTKSYVWPCPKSDWHWFTCVMGEYWGRFGFDSGGALHFINEKKSRRVDGIIGMCSFSLRLRSLQTTHYFTVLDTWPVLDFMYDAFLGYRKYAYLDWRFSDSKGSSAKSNGKKWINENYYFGWEYYNFDPIANYRR